MKIVHDSEVEAHGQQVITACAFIHSEIGGAEKVFLPKRASTKKFLPNVFELPGGHVDFGENIVDGLKREIKEELGMEIKVGDPFAAFDYTNEIKGSHSVEIIYFAKFTEPIENIKLNPEDHSEFVWFDGNDYSEILNSIKGEDDPEIKVIQKGFSLMNGQSLVF